MNTERGKHTEIGAAPHFHLFTGFFKLVTVARYPFKPAASIW